jgi:hypothetical protein
MQGSIEFLQGSAAAEGLKNLLHKDAFYELQLRRFGGTLFCVSELPSGALYLFGHASLEEVEQFISLLDAHVRNSRISMLQKRKFEEESLSLGRYAAFKYEFRGAFLEQFAVAN